MDWDGNLAKTLDVWLVACRVPLQKRGLILTDNEIATCFGMPIQRFQEWGIDDVNEAIGEMDELAAKLLPEVELYPHAIIVLEELRNIGMKLALITTSLRKNAINLLDKYNMHQFFDAVVTYEDTVKHKPHPEPLEKALQQLRGNAAQAVMIGDSDKDIGAAHNAGVDSILYFPPSHTKFYRLDDLKQLHPTYIVDDLRQILEIV